MIRVSEHIKHEGIKSWNDGDIVTIEAGTGAGKSYFIKNMLYSHAEKNHKKILFLIHRSNCITQFQKEIEKDKKTNTIHIKTYQSLEALYRNNRQFDFSPYQYIVCDEFHYFMSDATFNKFTDMSLNAILEESKSTRIFMSATGDYMERYITGYKKLNVIDYKLPINYSFIKTLTFYNKDDSLHDFMKQAIDQNIKSIFFIENAEKAYSLYKKYEEYCIFNCSKGNKKYYKYVDEEKINGLLEKERFEELILITTTVMDAGVNIKDLDLTHVICDVKDIDTLIQCIGRKRIQNKNDKIHLTIKTINNKSLGGTLTQLNKKFEMAMYLRNNSVIKYIEKYPRDYDRWSIVYTDVVEGHNDKATLKINKLMYFKCLMDYNKIESMLNNYKEFGYCKYLAHKFGFFDQDDNMYTYGVYEEDNNKMNLEDYLKSITGKKLLKNDQSELIEKIDLRVNGRQQKSYKKLNEGLEMIKLPFVILPKRTSNERYWILEQIEK